MNMDNTGDNVENAGNYFVNEAVGLPREIVTGVHWLGACQGYSELHGYNSTYLAVGENASAIIECGAGASYPHVIAQLEAVEAIGIPPVKYIFTTHQEVPHSGSLGLLLERFPEAVACGPVAEFHLVFPEFEDRLVEMEIGESVDLGGTTIDVLEAPFRDYLYTRWYFDSTKKVIFTGDGFAYSHYHGAGHCGHVAEEVPELALPEMTARFAENAFWWTTHVDIEPYVARLEWLLETTGAKTLAPTHGLPVLDIPKTLPELIKGLRLMSKVTADGRARVPVLGI
ncbi:conserved hypothetical protein [metagenome]|uniref:Metallo-beta-lactamase domain-containing protein n=1 Tax=metagenome TaxID=256318 RepID=A0A2P2C8T8_9ZZZZ